MSDPRQPRVTVTDDDFLLGSVWEGTGDELHTNRHAARGSIFGQRVLSGISGMLISLQASAPDLLWATPPAVEWSFDGPLFEGAGLEVASRLDGAGDRRFTVVSGDRQRGHGLIHAAPRPVPAPVEGRRTRGRTLTGADVRLLRRWLPPPGPASAEVAPWPLLLLVTSGLVVRDRMLGHSELTLNRWLRWVPLSAAQVDDTVHCVVGAPERRPSQSRPELEVVAFQVDVVSSVTLDRIAHVDWVMLCG